MIDLEKRKQDLDAAGHKRLETEKIVEEAMAIATDYQTIFAEGSVEEKRFFIRSFLSGIKLDPVRHEAEARFILLPGLDKAWSPNNLPDMPLNTAIKAQKNPKNREMSSRLIVAAQGFEPRIQD